MSKTANFQYKCRRCGNIHIEGYTSEDNAFIILCATLIDTPMPKEMIGQRPNLLTFHSCHNGYGVSDLIGYAIKETS